MGDDFLDRFKAAIKKAEHFHNTSPDKLIVGHKRYPIKLAIVRLDGAPSQRSKKLKDWANASGVSIERNAPRTHHQMGDIETEFNPLGRAVIATLLTGNAPYIFWDVVALQWILIRNLIKLPNSDYSPYEVWWSFARKTETSILNRLRVMFCAFWPHLSKEIRTKLDIRSLASIYLGWSEDYKAHRALVIESGVVVVSEFGSFNESIFPFDDPRVWQKLGMVYNDYYCEKKFADQQGECGLARQQMPHRMVDFPSKVDFSKISRTTITSKDYAKKDITIDPPGVDVATKVEYKRPIFGSQDRAPGGQDWIDAEELELGQSQLDDPAAELEVEAQPAEAIADGDGDPMDAAAGKDSEPEQDLDPGIECEVERIVPRSPAAHWRVPEGKSDPELHFLIKWKGYSNKHNSWVPASEVADGDKRTAYWSKHGPAIEKAGVKISTKLLADRSVAQAKVALMRAKADCSLRRSMTDELLGMDWDPSRGTTQARSVLPEDKEDDKLTLRMASVLHEHLLSSRVLAMAVATTSSDSARGRPSTRTASVDDPPLDMKMPTSLPEALKTVYAPQWQEAWDTEMNGFKTLGVWEEVKYEKSMGKLIGLKPIFSVKRRDDGTLEKFKVRIVAQGFTQIEGVHFDDVSSSVVRLATIRLLCSIFAGRDDVMAKHLDASQAFLWSELDPKHKIYFRPLAGFGLPEDVVLKAIKAVYGLRQAGACWAKALSDYIKGKLSFTQSQFDESVYYKRTDLGFIILLIFVDDCLCFTDSAELYSELLAGLNKRFKFNDLGDLKWFLSIKFDRNVEEGYFDLSQEQYNLSIVRLLGLENCNPVASPEVKQTLSTSDGASTPDELAAAALFPYRQVIGMLLFTCICCRPDYMHALKVLCQFVQNPGPKHIQAAKHLVRYVAGCPGAALRLHGPRGRGSDIRATLGICCDSDDSNNVDNRRSINCVLSFLGDIERPSFFDWANKFTINVPKSSTDSEIYSLDRGHRALLFWRPFLDELGFPQKEATKLYTDSQAAWIILNGAHPGRFGGVKHLARRYFALQQAIQAGVVELLHLPSKDQPADLGAAFKGGPEFAHLRNIIMGNSFEAARVRRKIARRQRALSGVLQDAADGRLEQP